MRFFTRFTSAFPRAAQILLPVLLLPLGVNAADGSLVEGPRILSSAPHEIGHRIADLPFLDTQGHRGQLSDFTQRQALVLALFGPECPISNRFGPELARLEKEYAAHDIAFLFVAVAADDSKAAIAAFVSKFHLQSPVLLDPEGNLARALGAKTTTETFLLDRTRTLVYRGAVNDQYGLGYNREAPRQTYLRNALDALLQDRAPEIAATTAPGCALDLAPASTAAAAAPTPALTFNHQISRIFQAHCVECHHENGLAPFGLETYEEVVENAGMIKKQVARGAMPPWFAVTPAGQESPWMNDRTLTPQDKADLLAWLSSDRAKGDPADAPLPRKFTSAWTIGEPDVVFKIPRPVAVQAEGYMPYQFQVAATDFREDRWVQAYEVRPSVSAVVHHVIVSVHPKDTKASPHSEGAGGFWAAYVPGNNWRRYPDGFARKLSAGDQIGFQIHYTPNGTAVDEQVEIGLIFAKGPPRYEMHAMGIPQFRLRIPPGEAHHVETVQYTLPRNLMVTGYQAHSHLRCTSYKFDAIRSDGAEVTLLNLPHYDFNWQLQYNYIEPRLIPAGSKIKVTATFDNSRGNPANPDPDKTVRWGPQTYDEMMIGYIEYYTPVGEDPLAQAIDHTALLTGLATEGPTANIAGTWTLTMEKKLGKRPPQIELHQEGETLNGQYRGVLGEVPVQGAVRGSMLQFSATLKTPAGTLEVVYVGTLKGKKITGIAQLGPLGESAFTAERN